MRLSLDLTTEQHRQLKTLASYSGLTMKEFILTRVFAEEAKTIFSPRLRKEMSYDELEAAQNLMFKKAEVIAASLDKWERLNSRIEDSDGRYKI